MTNHPIIFEMKGYSPLKSANETSNSTDFSEYLWMEHEEQFEEEVMKELEEEALMNECIEAMLEEEMMELNDVSNFVRLDFADLVNRSDLNPDAAEFVPRSSYSVMINNP